MQSIQIPKQDNIKAAWKSISVGARIKSGKKCDDVSLSDFTAVADSTPAITPMMSWQIGQKR